MECEGLVEKGKLISESINLSNELYIFETADRNFTELISDFMKSFMKDLSKLFRLGGFRKF